MKMRVVVRGVGTSVEWALAGRASGAAWQDSIFEVFRNIGRFFRHLAWMGGHLRHRVSGTVRISPSHQALNQYFNTSSYLKDLGMDYEASEKRPEHAKTALNENQIRQFGAAIDAMSATLKEKTSPLAQHLQKGQKLLAASPIAASPTFGQVSEWLTGLEYLGTPKGVTNPNFVDLIKGAALTDEQSRVFSEQEGFLQGLIQMPQEKSLMEQYGQIMSIATMDRRYNTIPKYLGSWLRNGTCYGQTLAIAHALHISPQASFKDVLAQMTREKDLHLRVIRFQCAEIMRGTLQGRIEDKDLQKEAAEKLGDAMLQYVIGSEFRGAQQTAAQQALPWVELARVAHDGAKWSSENQGADRPLDRLMEPLEKEDAPEGVYLLNMVSAKQGHTITVRMKAGEYAFYDIWNTGGYLFKDKQTFLKALKSHLQSGFLEVFLTPKQGNTLYLERIEV